MGPESGPNVRVVAKIRGSTVREADPSKCGLAPRISANKPKGDQPERVTISFGEQSTASRKECYEVDFCYDQNEGNDVIFSREVKPLISGVFEGRNATIIAHGARSGGKTYMIQGTKDELGVAVLTMAELLSMAVQNGKSILISFYEIVKEHVYDLLDPKRTEVLILESQGKVQLKGLSQVPVTSMFKFQKLYGGGCGSRKSEKKIPTEPPHRSHKGLIIYISSSCENLDTIPAGKMNFIDLTGYEDTRRKSSDGPNFLQNTKINKSIYALQNVVYSLKANENHVPYRESKLTRLLQDSMGGTSRTLMITCLSPWFCQESIYMLSLASRCYQGINRIASKPTKKIKCSARTILIGSRKARVLESCSTTAKKPTFLRVQFSEKKRNLKGSAMIARKLFDEASHLKFEKTRSLENVSVTNCSQEKEEKLGSHIEDPTSVSVQALSLANCMTCETTVSAEDLLHDKDSHKEVMPGIKVLSVYESGKDMDKENDKTIVNEAGSPPISARLQELSNNLKSLYFSTPSSKNKAEKNCTPAHDHTSIGLLELRTPEGSMQAKYTEEAASICTPWTTFNSRSSVVKNSLTHEYLRFLNTANREELKKLKGIGDKRATYILELRKASPEPFKNLDDLKNIGLSTKQVKRMMGQEVAELFG